MTFVLLLKPKSKQISIEMTTHQTPEQIFQDASPEQKLLWNYVFLRWGERVAVSQLVIRGSAGELTVYDANKLYFAYQIQFSPSGVPTPWTAPSQYIACFDENNAAIETFVGTSLYWDVTAAQARSQANTINIKNFLFGRIVPSAGSYGITFIGYRLGI